MQKKLFHHSRFQFISHFNDRYSYLDGIKMALEGGCRWIQLRMKDATDDEVEAEMKNVADKYGMDLDTVKKYLRPEEVKEQVIREKVIKVVADSAKAVAPAEEKAELEAEGEIVEKPAKKPAAKKTTKKAEGEEKAEKAPAKKPAAKKTAKKDAELFAVYEREKPARRGENISPAAAGSYEKHSRVGIIRHLSYRRYFL